MTDINQENQEKRENEISGSTPPSLPNQPSVDNQSLQAETREPEQTAYPQQEVKQPQQAPQQQAGYQEAYNQQNQGGSQQQTYYQGQPKHSQSGANYDPNAPQQTPPENNMTMSIVATVLGVLCCSNCCISAILGVIAIVFSSQVSTKFIAGDIDGAMNSAKTAKTLAIISLALTGVTFIGGTIYYIVLFATGGFETMMEQYMDALEQLN